MECEDYLGEEFKTPSFICCYVDTGIEIGLLNRGTSSVCFQISKNKRHQDRAAALEVWEKLEEFVRSRSHS